MTSPRRADLLAGLAALLVRPWIATLRFQIIDQAGVLGSVPQPPLLWAFWHNRLFVMPHLFQRYFPGRLGAALASQSKDGDLIAAVLRRFGIRPIRGSSSRRGAAALVEMKRAIRDGYIMAITPDGPRGPRYHVNPGLIKLAQITDGTVLPIHVTFSHFWQLKSWDGFMIPRPFSAVEYRFAPLHHIRRPRMSRSLKPNGRAWSK
jgi:lysophospholipid acyltransferase (LPLAT)-like uncharacterized protein